MSEMIMESGLAPDGRAKDIDHDSWTAVDERTPLLRYSAPINTPVGVDRPPENADQLRKERATSPITNKIYPAPSQSSDSSVENGGFRFERRQHCHRSSSEVAQIDHSARRRLICASVICLLFMIGEVVGGILANSLAIATDAAHLLTDFASFLISLFSLILASRPPTKRMSFGWYRAEMMGALLSVLLIWVVTGVLVYMAILRVVSQNYEIDASVMLITAGIGVLFNFIMGFLLHDHGHSHTGRSFQSKTHPVRRSHSSHLDNQDAGDHTSSNGGSQGNRVAVEPSLHSSGSHTCLTNSDGVDIRMAENGTNEVAVELPTSRNINVRAAFIHVIGDLAQSFGVLTAAYIIYYKPEWKLADPICTFVFSILVICTTITILKDILNVLMEGAPHNISFNDVKQCLCSIEGVREVHNLRLWSLTMSRVALSAHLALDNTVSPQEVIKKASQLMSDCFGIHECTVQTEDYSDEMNDCIHCKDPKD